MAKDVLDKEAFATGISATSTLTKNLKTSIHN